MNITPLLLFFILLFTLILSSIFSKYTNSFNLNTEGFINFNYDTNPLMYVYIPQYSSSSSNVVKLFDNILYDTTNGNMIEVDGVSLNGNSSPSSSFKFNNNKIDYNGLSINSIYVLKREGNKSPSNYTTLCSGNVMLNGNLVCGGNTVSAFDTNESKIPIISNTTNAWYYITQSLNTDKYMICYIPWSTSTFIHIINTKTKTHISSFLFKDSEVAQTYVYNNNLSINVGKAIPDNNPNNGFLVLEPLYDTNNKVLQLSSTVKFDLKNSYLIVNSSNGLITYNRYGNVVSDKKTRETSISKTIFQPWIVSDNANNMILYMQDRTNTVVAYITILNNEFALTYVFLIDANMNFIELPKDNLSNIFKDVELEKLLKLFDKNVQKDEKSDYILKSQIVPPVCPSCPSCPSFNGTCVNCKKLTDDVAKPSSTVLNKNDTQPSTTASTVNAETPLPEYTNKNNTPLPEANTNINNTPLPEANTNVKNTIPYSEAGTSSSIAGINHYSQYGASNSSSSNFIPITADFSSFGN